MAYMQMVTNEEGEPLGYETYYDDEYDDDPDTFYDFDDYGASDWDDDDDDFTYSIDDPSYFGR